MQEESIKQLDLLTLVGTNVKIITYLSICKIVGM